MCKKQNDSRSTQVFIFLIDLWYNSIKKGKCFWNTYLF